MEKAKLALRECIWAIKTRGPGPGIQQLEEALKQLDAAETAPATGAQILASQDAQFNQHINSSLADLHDQLKDNKP